MAQDPASDEPEEPSGSGAPPNPFHPTSAEVGTDEDGMVPGSTEVSRTLETHAKRTRLRRGCTVSILTLGFLVLCAELFLRLTDDRERALEAGTNRTNLRWLEVMQAGIFEELPDPVRRYAMRPGASCEVDGWTFRVTRHRTRGADFPAEKLADERRILALGDSFCFGMWCDEDETVVGHLARMANAREAQLDSGLHWRAVNLGVPGYHSGQQLRSLEQDGLALEPDLVVLYYNTNDIAREGYFYDEDLGAIRSDYLPLPTWLRRPLWNSHLYGLIARKHYQSLRAVPNAPFDPNVPWAHVREDNKQATRAAITAIARICRERDVPLFFVNQPFISWSGDARQEDWSMLPLNAWAEDLRLELELPGVNLLGWWRGYADGVDRFPAPPDYLPDLLLADPAVERMVAQAREFARGDDANWETLPLNLRMGYVDRALTEAALPPEVDFHFTGEGYGRIARLCYARLQSEGLLP